MRIKIKLNNETMLVGFGVAVFIFNSVFRSSVFTVLGISATSLIFSVNLIALFCFAIIGVRYVSKPIPKKISTGILSVLIIAYMILTLIANDTSKLGRYVIIASILPGMFLLLPDYRKTDIKFVYKKILRIFNIVFGTLFVIGMFDYFMGGSINEFIATYLSDDNWALMIRSEMSTYGYRIVTILGSPLMNAFYALMLMVLNVCYEKMYEESVTNKYIIYILSVIAIFLSGSRAALLFGVLFILISELLQKYGFVKILVVLFAFAILINTPLFQETVGNRLNLGFMNQSDARYQMILQLQNKAFGSPRLFSGGGYGYSRKLTSSATSLTSNFEYPILMFLYDYGIVATVLYYAIFGVYPLIMFFKYQSKWLAFGYYILFGFMQTCNPIAQYYDFNLEFGFLIVIMIETARRCSTRKEIYDLSEKF